MECLLSIINKRLDIGNIGTVVEHDEDSIRRADHIIDIGPGAGVHGGEIIAQGDIEAIMASEESITGQYLTGNGFLGGHKDRKSTRLNSSHVAISYAVFCLKKKNTKHNSC